MSIDMAVEEFIVSVNLIARIASSPQIIGPLPSLMSIRDSVPNPADGGHFELIGSIGGYT